jgi:hypothetical protein
VKCERLRGIASFVIRLAFARLIAIREALRFVGKPLLFSKTYAVAIAIASDGKTLYTALAQHGFKSRMAFSSDYGGQAGSDLQRRFGSNHLSPITFHFSPSLLASVTKAPCLAKVIAGVGHFFSLVFWRAWKIRLILPELRTQSPVAQQVLSQATASFGGRSECISRKG